MPSFRNGIVRYLNTSDGISELTAAQLRTQIDPLGIGLNPKVLEYMSQYPLPNDNSVGDSINGIFILGGAARRHGLRRFAVQRHKFVE